MDGQIRELFFIPIACLLFAAEEMVGANVKSMVLEQEAFQVGSNADCKPHLLSLELRNQLCFSCQALLQRGADTSPDDFDTLKMDVHLCNKYTGNIPCHLAFSLGGELAIVSCWLITQPSALSSSFGLL